MVKRFIHTKVHSRHKPRALLARQHMPTIRPNPHQWMAYCLVTLCVFANPLLKAEEPQKAAAGATHPAEEEILTNATIIELAKLGLGENLLIDKIRTSRCNFDVSISGIKQLKAGNVPDPVISAMLGTAKGTPGRLNEAAGNPNDPKSPHDAGIYLATESQGRTVLTKCEPTVYAQQKAGAALFAAYGQTAKTKAVLRPSHAVLTTSSRRPVFYFYFENTKSGLGETVNIGTSPNEFILAQFVCSEDDNFRSLVVGSMNMYSGSQAGPEDKSIRPFDFEKLAPGIYKVSPKQDLRDGEYCFFYAGNAQAGSGMTATGNKVFDFGVRAGTSD